MSPQPQIPREPPIQYSASSNMIMIEKQEKGGSGSSKHELEVKSVAINSGNQQQSTFKHSRTPETMVQLMDGVATTEASDNDNDEGSNNDDIIEEDSGDHVENHQHKSPDQSQMSPNISTTTQEEENILASAIAGNKKVSTYR